MGRALMIGLAVAVSASAVAACSGGNGSDDAVDGSRDLLDRPATTGTAPHGGSPSTDAPGVATGPTVASFDVPASVTCAGDTTTVTVRYEAVGAEAVAFLVDQQPVTGGQEPPTAGNHALDLPCDGRTHTVVLVAVGPTGQTLDSRAVRTEPGP